MNQVFIVDDDSGLRSALAQAVVGLGYGVRTAIDGSAAVRALAAARTDIVLSDWTMPEMNGLDLCTTLKSWEQPPYVILMTAFERSERLVSSMRAGADDFIRKPVDLEELEVRLLAASRQVDSVRALAVRNRELQTASDVAHALARTDGLTGVGNRLAFQEELARLAANGTRYTRRLAVALCDVDLFKLYNDSCGHAAGDEALRQVAGCIRASLREGDVVYRYGGEEFVVFLPEQTEREALNALERVRANLQQARIPHPRAPLGMLTISVGVAELTDSGIHNCVERADAALYRAKHAGRNCVATWLAPPLGGAQLGKVSSR